MMSKLNILGLLFAVLLLSACASDQQPNKTATGAGIGAVGGAVIGHQLGDHSDTNTALGGVAGGVIGGAIGHRIQQREQNGGGRALTPEQRCRLFLDCQ